MKTATKHKIYLGGPMQHLHKQDVVAWREALEDKYKLYDNVELINPLDQNPSEHKASMIDDHEEIYFHRNEIVRSDLVALRKATGLLVNWVPDVETAGTPMEMVYAVQWSTPIALVYSGNEKMLSPWLHYHADEVFDILEDGIEFLLEVNDA